MNRLAATGLALAIFALGCESTTEPADETLAPSESVEPTDAPTLNTFVNNPDGGGPHIFRLDDGRFVFLLVDPETSLAAIHATQPDVCGGTLAPADVQLIVENPDGPDFGHIRRLVLADEINIFVVDAAQPGACFGVRVLASGPGKLVDTDNDVLQQLEAANAFGFSAHGTLTGSDGRRGHYNGVNKVVVGPEVQVTRQLNFQWIGQ